MWAPAPFQSPFSGLASKLMITSKSSAMRCSSQRATYSWSLTVGGAGGADLELPLAGHDLGVGAADHQPGVDAGLGVHLDDVAPDDAAGADAAVVRALRTGEALLGEAERRAVGLEHRVLLLDAEQQLLLGVLLGDLLARGAGVGRVRLHVDAVSTSARTRTLSPPRSGSGHTKTGLSTQSLFSPVACSVRRSVEAPDPGLGAVGDDLRLGAEQRRRLHAVEPDVFSLVGHRSRVPLGTGAGCDEAGRRPFPGDHRRVNAL